MISIKRLFRLSDELLLSETAIFSRHSQINKRKGITMKVKNITSNNGNKIANQFIITDNNGTEYFQSYKSIIVKRTINNTYLDEYYWEYSVTTGKYRNIFLNETKKETLKKIKNGIYKLTNLNK
tara:strand:- start:105 stop:476 length:372 start_codon:yes stop_codon:yes gene_type:complete